MLDLAKKIIRKSFLYNPLLWIKRSTQIFANDLQLFPVRQIRSCVRAKRFPIINSAFLPMIAHIEVTNVCNAECVMCPQSVMKRKSGTMESSLFRNIIQQCRPFETLWMFMMGEPLMDRNLPKRISYAKRAGIKKVGIFTNGSLLNPDVSYKLLVSGIDHITVSFDALTKETFMKIRPALNFQEVASNIENLVKLRSKLRQKKPFIAIEFVRMTENATESEPFRRKWGKIVDAVYIANTVNWSGANKERPAVRNSYKIRRPCYLLWKDMVIFTNGEVPLCCYDYEGSVILGDVSKQPLKEIWTGGKLTQIRNLHLKGQFEKISICANCNAWEMPSSPWWW